MKFLQLEESSGKATSVTGGTSKPSSPIADDKAEEVCSCSHTRHAPVQPVHSLPLQVAEQQYKRIVAEAESRFINVLTSDRAPHHRSLESSSKSQQYSKRLHRCYRRALACFFTYGMNRFFSIDLSQARQCGLTLPISHTTDADIIKLLQAPRNCQFSGSCCFALIFRVVSAASQGGNFLGHAFAVAT
jgi:hypothetical protein